MNKKKKKVLRNTEYREQLDPILFLPLSPPLASSKLFKAIFKLLCWLERVSITQLSLWIQDGAKPFPSVKGQKKTIQGAKIALYAVTVSSAIFFIVNQSTKNTIRTCNVHLHSRLAFG